MRAPQQIRVTDILEMAQSLYTQIEEKVHRVASHEKNAESLAMLEFIEQRTHLLNQTLQKSGDAGDRAAETWLAYHPEFVATERLELLAIGDEVSTEDAVTAVLSMEECLLKLYRETADIAGHGPAKELFANLAAIQESGSIELVSAAVRGYY